MSTFYPRLISLEPYAIAAISRYCPCLGAKLRNEQTSKTVRLVGEDDTFFRVAVLENDMACRELAIACPVKMRDLFYRTPNTHLGSKVLHLLQSSYEHWLQDQGLTHPLQLPVGVHQPKDCKCPGNNQSNGCPNRSPDP